ncbi:MAG: hypothetical protein QXU40_02535 [Candidatus Pacearchaeota archaeon]
MKRLFLIVFMIIPYLILGQNIFLKLPNTIWEHTTEKYIYLRYTYNKIFEIDNYLESMYPEGKIAIIEKKYGFYDSCNLPSLDSLKDSGKYYFELDSTDFKDEEVRKMNTDDNCAELNIYTYEGDTLMTIYYSSRQQFVTYKKIDSLPEIVTKYLKEKGIEVKKK